MHNDYELIYLVQCHYDRESRKKLFHKYKGLIYKIVKKHNYIKEHENDFISEAYIKLNHAVVHFRSDRNKSFTKYFELILRRDIIKKASNYYYQNKKTVVTDIKTLNHLNYTFKEDDQYYLTNQYHFKSELLNDVFQLIFYQHKSIQEVAINLNLSKKQIYNAIYRIKEHIKNNN